MAQAATSSEQISKPIPVRWHLKSDTMPQKFASTFVVSLAWHPYDYRESATRKINLTRIDTYLELRDNRAFLILRAMNTIAHTALSLGGPMWTLAKRKEQLDTAANLEPAVICRGRCCWRHCSLLPPMLIALSISGALAIREVGHWAPITLRSGSSDNRLSSLNIDINKALPTIRLKTCETPCEHLCRMLPRDVQSAP